MLMFTTVSTVFKVTGDDTVKRFSESCLLCKWIDLCQTKNKLMLNPFTRSSSIKVKCQGHWRQLLSIYLDLK